VTTGARLLLNENPARTNDYRFVAIAFPPGAEKRHECVPRWRLPLKVDIAVAQVPTVANDLGPNECVRIRIEADEMALFGLTSDRRPMRARTDRDIENVLFVVVVELKIFATQNGHARCDSYSSVG
jgi:hypothetical protein